MAENPLKWPAFEQLGRDFYECVQPAIEQLAAGSEELDDEAKAGLSQLETWLNAPCVATVKLDGTNVGVDNAGLVVGRNTAVEPGASYQKVDVWTLLADCPGKAELVRAELARAAGQEEIAQAMLYGELVVNGKYDYGKAGIYKRWLCFGAMLRAGADDEGAGDRLAAQLRAAGYNTCAHGGRRVLVAPNLQLDALLADVDVLCISGGYRPAGIGEAQWAAHDGQGGLPRFRSMRRLLESAWAQRLLLPEDGTPLGEGLVVCSEADGRLFKWKHAGEELGKVPQQLGQVVGQLRGLEVRAGRLPEGLLAVFERLLLVATAGPRAAAPAMPQPKAAREEDAEALAVWRSALTKFDALEEAFRRGGEAMAAQQNGLIEQVAGDLVKDYGADEKAARQRATKVVKAETGRAFGAWKRAQASGA